MNTAAEILDTLDRVDRSSFPIVTHEFFFPAAARLSLFRSLGDWALVIELFRYASGSEPPDTVVTTLASRLSSRPSKESYVTGAAHARYIACHPNDQTRFAFPIDEGDWQDDDGDHVALGASRVNLRGRPVPIPERTEFSRLDIALRDPQRFFVFELCRYLATVARNEVLATPEERRINVPSDLQQILQLEGWNHPELIDKAHPPSASPTFQQLAKVLETGDTGLYHPSLPANTHWRNWPEAGSLSHVL